MNSITLKERKEIISRNLRLISTAVEVADSPAKLRFIREILTLSISILNLCLYENQQELIVNAQHDIMKEAA